MNKLSSLFINPVLNKEIKLRFRSFKSFLGILFYLAVCAAVCLAFIWIEGHNRNGFTANDSRTLFLLLSMGQMGLIAFITPGLTAGAISGERERQTLNILLTTQQSSMSIVISKLFSSLAFLVLMLIASLPLYSLVFLYGGVSPKMVLITFGLHLLTMLMIGSLGVMFSTIIRKTMVATITTYGVMLFFVVGTGLLYILLGEIMYNLNQNPTTTNQRWLPYISLMLNPGIVLFNSFEAGGLDYALQRLGITWPIWKGFTLSYIGISIFALFVSIMRLRPRMRSKKVKKKAS
ncbi:ABC transporter permease [Pontibacillus sp. HMF3514]|uniref:ABC transporter permease n=1 Tax=Pontibacillus sp. HMF3514 TaxID=2692425 RepID=UPI00131FC030|nr:ABC transporter permease subunit [Pontibacillus sp. HMF3514]QHE51762.1 ABC transporter permease subunit [Pontibacillus sp. HMF3514]